MVRSFNHAPGSGGRPEARPRQGWTVAAPDTLARDAKPVKSRAGGLAFAMHEVLDQAGDDAGARHGGSLGMSREIARQADVGGAGDVSAVKGRRLPDGFLRHGAFRPGDYQIVTAGSENVLGLWVLPPGGRYPRHVIDRPYVEHPDGTVSVEGPLRFDGWEGFLERGVWRKA